MNSAELAREARDLRAQLNARLAFAKEQGKKKAEAEKKYRRGRSEAWLTAPEGVAKMREDWVDSKTSDLRYERDLAVGLERSAYEAIKSTLADMSLLQSVVKAYIAEANFDRTAPEESFA